MSGTSTDKEKKKKKDVSEDEIHDALKAAGVDKVAAAGDESRDNAPGQKETDQDGVKLEDMKQPEKEVKTESKLPNVEPTVPNDIMSIPTGTMDTVNYVAYFSPVEGIPSGFSIMYSEVDNHSVIVADGLKYPQIVDHRHNAKYEFEFLFEKLLPYWNPGHDRIAPKSRTEPFRKMFRVPDGVLGFDPYSLADDQRVRSNDFPNLVTAIVGTNGNMRIQGDPRVEDVVAFQLPHEWWYLDRAMQYQEYVKVPIDYIGQSMWAAIGIPAPDPLMWEFMRLLENRDRYLKPIPLSRREFEYTVVPERTGTFVLLTRRNMSKLAAINVMNMASIYAADIPRPITGDVDVLTKMIERTAVNVNIATTIRRSMTQVNVNAALEAHKSLMLSVSCGEFYEVELVLDPWSRSLEGMLGCLVTRLIYPSYAVSARTRTSLNNYALLHILMGNTQVRNAVLRGGNVPDMSTIHLGLDDYLIKNVGVIRATQVPWANAMMDFLVGQNAAGVGTFDQNLMYAPIGRGGGWADSGGYVLANAVSFPAKFRSLVGGRSHWYMPPAGTSITDPDDLQPTVQTSLLQTMLMTMSRTTLNALGDNQGFGQTLYSLLEGLMSDWKRIQNMYFTIEQSVRYTCMLSTASPMNPSMSPDFMDIDTASGVQTIRRNRVVNVISPLAGFSLIYYLEQTHSELEMKMSRITSAWATDKFFEKLATAEAIVLTYFSDPNVKQLYSKSDRFKYLYDILDKNVHSGLEPIVREKIGSTPEIWVLNLSNSRFPGQTGGLAQPVLDYTVIDANYYNLIVDFRRRMWTDMKYYGVTRSFYMCRETRTINHDGANGQFGGRGKFRVVNGAPDVTYNADDIEAMMRDSTLAQVFQNHLRNDDLVKIDIPVNMSFEHDPTGSKRTLVLNFSALDVNVSQLQSVWRWRDDLEYEFDARFTFENDQIFFAHEDDIPFYEDPTSTVVSQSRRNVRMFRKGYTYFDGYQLTNRSQASSIGLPT
jgi:hypothetical protein